MTKILSKIDLEKFEKEYNEYRNSDDYKSRQSQSKFIEVAQMVIRELLKKEKISNEDLTALIQMFNVSCKKGTFQKYLKSLHFSEEIEKEIFNKYIEIGQCGYTRVGKATIEGLSSEQLDTIRTFLKKIDNSENADQIKAAWREYNEMEIPIVTIGIYSPWLHYLKPELCPLIAGPVRAFLKKIGWNGDYSDAMDFFNILKNKVNEDNLGLIDFFLFNEKRVNSILRPENSKEDSRLRNEQDNKNHINILLEKKKQIILYGPPGTGKTFFTKRIAVSFIKKGGS